MERLGTIHGARRVGGLALAALLVVTSSGALIGTTPTSAQDVGTAATRTYNNGATPITILDLSRAQEYPNNQAALVGVSNLPGVVEDVELTLNGLSHQDPDNLDIMLEAPDGTAVIVMSDAGGEVNITNRTLTFVPSAEGAPLLTTNPIISGRYQATNLPQDGDGFSNPAPGPTGTSMDDFQGVPAAGTWKLYIMDDTQDGTGLLARGWSLRIHATDYPVKANNDSYSARENRTLRVRAPGVLKNDNDKDNDIQRIEVRNKPKKGNVKLRQDGSFVYEPDRNETGRDTFTYKVEDGGGFTDTATVTIDIKAGND